ncbi:MAG TPA: ATP-binding protein [Chloroflexota bacterium]|nr:ATP-binding protein [Chloroflexota bacterium]
MSLLPLPVEKLFTPCDISQFNFATTAELNEFDEIIGQDRAVSAIQFGIGIRHEGFNLFAIGPNGTGRFTAVHQFLTSRAPSEPTPSDWCYVHNFDQPHAPNALQLPPGQSSRLQQAMQQLVEDLFTIIPTAFTSEEYQAQRKTITAALKEKEIQALESLKEQADQRGIALLQTPGGFAFAPTKNGSVITPEEFLRLSTSEQQALEDDIKKLQESLQQIMQQVPQWHRETQQRLKELDQEIAAFAVRPVIDEIRPPYAELPDVLAYLDTVQADIIQNVRDFLPSEESPLADAMAPAGGSSRPRLARFQVNVIITHEPGEGAPVVHEELPTYPNLLGRVEHISQMGTLLTDFTLIKAGVLHKANGGYLILDARKVLLQPFAWEALKQALRSREIRIESLGQAYSLISTVSLEPQPIPLNVKVVLIGERLLYYLLCAYDPDFGELFKVAADFEDEMPRSPDNNLAYARLIANLAHKEGLRDFDRAAVGRILEQSARLAADAEKLTTHMQTVTDLLREADYWAGANGRVPITAADVEQALAAQLQRAGRIRERLLENTLRETLLVDTDGAVVGQINGLSVIDLGGQAFGRPSRITARVRLGKGEVIDIERQVEMGGPLHSKGVLILSGFLGARYAAERPLSLSASLVFEQSYGGVDGDSASSAELYALLSALAEAPLKQGLAVTGSVNQRGQVQAIGGVNEKIEGFFDLCLARGLTGNQGVLIPAANVKHLMLRQDVVAAVTAGQFAIYAANTIDEGIELLTGMVAGELDDDGRYPAESINGRVVARLETFAAKQREFMAPPESGNR